jgi:acetylglutamate kinase
VNKSAQDHAARLAESLASAKTLAEALPYIQIYDREIIVVKYGGHAMGDTETARKFAADVVLLKLVGMHPVVVHGGGPQISRMLEKAGVKSQFVDGLRVTDSDTMEVAEMVLSGSVNKELAHLITSEGAEADVRGVGLSGKDARIITCEKVVRTRKDPDSMIEQAVDLGFVGEPTDVDPTLIQALINAPEDYIPVIAPIGVAEDGRTYNINADTAAGAIAKALSAKRFLLLSDVPGVLDKDGELIREMSAADARTPRSIRRRHGRHDPETRNLHRRRRSRRRSSCHPRRAHAARPAHGIVHRLWRRHAHQS